MREISKSTFSAPILASKLFPPRYREGLILRRKLVQQFDAALKNRPQFVLVAAPAGYGKTTLVAEWLNETDGNWAWLTLDVGDNDPSRFLQYLMAALRTTSATVGSALDEVIKAPAQIQASILSVLLRNDIEDLDSAVTLILEDYHLIRNKMVHEIINDLIESQPELLNLVVITREDPQFSLARLRTQGRVTEFRANHLRFDAEETKAYITDVMNLRVDNEILLSLNKRIEGWVAGLKLAALSLYGLEDAEAVRVIEGFSGTSRYVVDYFGQEIYQALPEAIQVFLANTAFLRSVSTELCEWVTGDVNSGKILRELAEMGMFLVPIQGKSGWYRYHTLFADFLVASTSSDSRPQLHRKAAEWFEKKGMYFDALGHAILASDFGLARQIFLGSAPEYLEGGQYTTILGWLAKMPAQFMENDNDLSMYRGWALFLSGEIEETITLLLRIQKRSGDEKTARRLSVLRAWIGEAENEPLDAEALEHGPSVSEQDIPFFELHEKLLNFRSAFAAGRPLEAVDVANAIIEAARIAGSRFFLLCATHHLAYGLIDIGQRSKSERLCLHLIQELEQDNLINHWFSAMVYAPLSACRYLAGDIHHAAEYAELAYRHREIAGKFRYTLDDGALVLALSQIALGDFKAAQVIAEETGRSQLLAEISLRSGDITASWSHLNQRRPEYGCSSFGFLSRECIAYMEVMLASGQIEEALTLVEKLGDRAERNGNTVGRIYAHIYRGIIGYKQDSDKAFAKESIEKAIEWAMNDDYRRILIDVGAMLVPLFDLLEPEPFSFAGQVYDELPRIADSDSSIPIDASPEELSRREREVLQLVAAGKSNQEIADELFISLGTTKWHINNIFSKLGVKNRTSAINSARKRDIIPQEPD